MSSTSRHCLFGGTILAAGLMAATADAQIINVNTLQAYTNGNGAFSNTYGIPGAFSYTTGQGGAYGHASFDYTWWYVFGSVMPGAYGFAGGVIASYFQVGSATTMTAQWDFTDDSGGTSGIRVYDLTNNLLLLDEVLFFGGQVTGNVPLNFVPGAQYALIMAALTEGTGELHSFAMLCIPAPASAAGLIALSGLLATRRRRSVLDG